MFVTERDSFYLIIYPSGCLGKQIWELIAEDDKLPDISPEEVNPGRMSDHRN